MKTENILLRIYSSHCGLLVHLRSSFQIFCALVLLKWNSPYPKDEALQRALTSYISSLRDQFTWRPHANNSGSDFVLHVTSDTRVTQSSLFTFFLHLMSRTLSYFTNKSPVIILTNLIFFSWHLLTDFNHMEWCLPFPKDTTLVTVP